MFAVALGILATLSFLLAALNASIGSLDLTFWAGAWTASRAGR